MVTYYVSKIATSLIDSIPQNQWPGSGETRFFYKNVKPAISQADEMMKITESPEITYFVWMESCGRFVGVVWLRTGGEQEIFGMRERAIHPLSSEELI